MTHPLFYSPDVTGISPGDVVYLDAASSTHAIRSQRLAVNEPVLVADGAGTLAHGTIDSADPQRTGIQVSSVTFEPSPAVRINLVQALAKGDRDLLAAEMATEVGVDAVTPWQAQRSIVRIRPERAAKTRTKWEAKLQAAAQQSRRAHIPQLHPFIESGAIADLQAPDQGHHLIVLHEEGEASLQEVAQIMPESASVLNLVVGPEGGVAPEELAAAQNAGAHIVRIGTHVMRASTAGPIAIALLNMLFNRW